MNKRKKK